MVLWAGIVAQIVACVMLFLAWASPPTTGIDRESKDILRAGSFYVYTCRSVDEIVMASGDLGKGQVGYWHTLKSFPLPFSHGAKLHVARLNKFSRELHGYSF